MAIVAEHCFNTHCTRSSIIWSPLFFPEMCQSVAAGGAHVMVSWGLRVTAVMISSYRDQNRPLLYKTHQWAMCQNLLQPLPPLPLCLCVCVCVCSWVYVPRGMCMFMCVCVCWLLSVCVCVCVCACVHMDVCGYVCGCAVFPIKTTPLQPTYSERGGLSHNRQLNIMLFTQNGTDRLSYQCLSRFSSVNCGSLTFGGIWGSQSQNKCGSLVC